MSHNQLKEGSGFGLWFERQIESVLAGEAGMVSGTRSCWSLVSAVRTHMQALNWLSPFSSFYPAQDTSPRDSTSLI